MFSPRTPVILPAFLPNPLLSDGGCDYTGHVDIAFEVDRYGRSRHVRVLDTSNDARSGWSLYWAPTEAFERGELAVRRSPDE